MKYKLYFALALFFYVFIASPQSNAVKITHYDKEAFNADSQFWTACEDSDGVLYFGNNDGVLIYDGQRWQKILLPNNSSVRSLTAGADGTIYVGAYNETGTLQKDESGKFYYTSLLKKLQLGGKNIENIWDIQLSGNSVLYRAYSQVVVLSGNVATHIPATTSFIFSAMVGKSYYLQEAGNGILRLDANGGLSRIFSASDYEDKEVIALLPDSSPDILTAITVNGMVYRCNINRGSMQPVAYIFAGLPRDVVSSAVKRPDGSILIGTTTSKIIAYYPDGTVDSTPEIFYELGQNVIHKLYQAKDNNLWVLQNNGLDYIDFKSPYVSLFNKASVYDVLVHDETIYVATAQGVYYAPFSRNKLPLSGDFKKIAGLQGQTWSVQLLEGDIIISQDSGIFLLKDNLPIPVGTAKGFWKVSPIEDSKGRYLASHYNGLYLLEKKNGTWTLHDKIAGFNESARDIMPAGEPGTYWICHGYQGVFRVHINSEYTRVVSVDRFTDKNGLKNAYNVNVSRWNGEIIFTTNTGVYTFNRDENQFKPYQKLNTILDPDKNTRKILQHGDKTWFVQDDEAGYFYTDDEGHELYKDLFLNLKGSFNRGMESLTPIGNSKMLFGTSNGLFLYNTRPAASGSIINTLITGVTYGDNNGHRMLPLNQNKAGNHILPNQTSMLRFDFAAPNMPHGTQVQYSYKLQNTDESWSAWQTQPYKEYTHLPPGDYTFKVRSRNTAGIQGGIKLYSFTVEPKWYQTPVAYILYVVAGLTVLLGIRALIRLRIRHERKKSQREAAQARKLLELEVEQLKLQRDKEAMYRDKAVLEQDVVNKSKELANYTMMLVQKKEVFAELDDDLKELKGYVRNEDSRKKLLEIFRKLNQHKIGEEYMEVFDVNFEKVHHNFFESLKKLNPDINKRELRLCAFVKMNLTNKEIAPLLGISLRGVENARYRIRKKLDVATDENFAAFLEQVDKENQTI